MTQFFRVTGLLRLIRKTFLPVDSSVLTIVKELNAIYMLTILKVWQNVALKYITTIYMRQN